MTEQVDPLVAEALEVASILTDMRAPLSIKAAAILRTQAERIATMTAFEANATQSIKDLDKALGKVLVERDTAEVLLAKALAALEQRDAEIDTFIGRLNAQWFLAQNWFPESVNARATLSRLTAGEKKGGE